VNGPRWGSPVRGCYILAIIVAAAIAIRVIPFWDDVFTPRGVWFTEADAWYYLRMVDYTVANWPHHLTFDYYALYPGGKITGYYPLLVWLVALPGVLGRPGWVDTWAAVLPPLFSGVLVVLVYLWCREVLRGREDVSLVAAFLAALMPSEVMHRGILGFTDQHILEMVLWASTMLFITKAVNNKQWQYWLLALLSLGLYLLNWHGGLFLVAVLGLWVFYKIYRYWPGLLLLGFPSLILLIVLYPGQVKQGLHLVALVFNGFGSDISEARPTDGLWLFMSYGLMSLFAFWGLYVMVKHREDSLFVISTLFLILAVTGQRRWHYYLGMHIAILAAYALVMVLEKLNTIDYRRWLQVAVVLALIGALIPGWWMIARMPNNMTVDWWNALVWLRDNTPEPFNNPGAYYQPPDTPASYGVLTWWDYGHWVIRVSHRVPTGSPAWQEVSFAYDFLAAQSDEDAGLALVGYDVRYVIVDREMVEGQFSKVVKKYKGTDENWQTLRPPSMANRLYTTNEAGGYYLAYQSGDVKVFERGVKFTLARECLKEYTSPQRNRGGIK